MITIDMDLWNRGAVIVFGGKSKSMIYLDGYPDTYGILRKFNTIKIDITWRTNCSYFARNIKYLIHMSYHMSSSHVS